MSQVCLLLQMLLFIHQAHINYFYEQKIVKTIKLTQ